MYPPPEPFAPQWIPAPRPPRRSGTATALLFGAAVVLGSAVTAAGLVIARPDGGAPEQAPVLAADTAADPTEVADAGIRSFDFDNAVTYDTNGEDHELDDGKDKKMSILEGPVYADADADGDLDAAVIYQEKSDESTRTAMYLWRWVGDIAVQVDDAYVQSTAGDVHSLTSTATAFGVTIDVLDPSNDPVPEQVTIGMIEGYPVVTEPGLSAVDRCGRYRPSAETSAPVSLRSYPADHAPVVALPADLSEVTVFESDWTSEAWSLVAGTRSDGTETCGWARTDDLDSD